LVINQFSNEKERTAPQLKEKEQPEQAIHSTVLRDEKKPWFYLMRLAVL